MPVRTADAEWNGTLQEGSGHMRMATGSYDGAYSYAARFEEGEGTNPEELIAAAHAGCFSMHLAGQLGKAGFAPGTVRTTATVHLDKGEAGFSITKIELETEAAAPGIPEDRFRELVEFSKANCPISKALAAVHEITVSARLV
jgi:osmotically inducible protein OsmC